MIFVGEIRDTETASLALSAAETGHLVFSTLHTRDAKGALSRIVDMFPAEQTKAFACSYPSVSLSCSAKNLYHGRTAMAGFWLWKY